MKAIRCHEYGALENLILEEIESPQPGPNQVLIRVQSAAVNFPDNLLVKGLYQRRPDTPFTPGAEVAGTVRLVGSEVTSCQPGDVVAAKMLDGGYAEEALAPANDCHILDSEVDMRKASAFLVTYGTSYHALKDRGHLMEGETVAVLGAAGGVGLAAIELAKLMGARVIACASTGEKLALCEKYGADDLLNYSEKDLRDGLKSILNGKGLDMVVDPVGGKYAEPAIRSLNFGGRYLVIGFTDGAIPKIPLNIPLLKSCSIVGVFWGRFMKERPVQARANHELLTSWLNQGKINPHIHKGFPLEKAVEAMKWVDDRQVLGKVVLDM